jgi:hypothetical protein
MVLGAVSEGVDTLLIDLEPFSRRQFCPRLRFHFLWLHHHQCHC